MGVITWKFGGEGGYIGLTSDEIQIVEKLERCCEAHEKECQSPDLCQKFVDTHLLTKSYYHLPKDWTMADLHAFMYHLWHDGRVSRRLFWRSQEVTYGQVG